MSVCDLFYTFDISLGLIYTPDSIYCSSSLAVCDFGFLDVVLFHLVSSCCALWFFVFFFSLLVIVFPLLSFFFFFLKVIYGWVIF